MQSHWILEPKPLTGQTVSLAYATTLMQKLGMGHQHAVAEGLLNLLGEHVPLAQCTIFAYEGLRAPRIVAVGDRLRTQALADIAEAYVSSFYRLDGCMSAMREELSAARKAGMQHPRIVMHRQTGADIAHDAYRHACYERPQVAERLALLALFEGRRWLAVNLYRGLEHGPFDAASIDVVSAFAPLIVHAVRLHHTGQSVNQELGDLLLARLRARHPQLTPRDCDVVRSLLDGQSSAAMAERLGLTLASARTYVKRVYRKLGVSGQRDLMGMLLEPGIGA